MDAFFYLILGAIAILSLIFHSFYVNSRFGVKDIPNERSLHAEVTKKSGGMVFIPFFIFSLFFLTSEFSPFIFDSFSPLLPLAKEGQTFIYSMLFGIFTLMFLGFLDDLYHLSPKLRLVLELTIVGIFVFFTTPSFRILDIYLPNHFFIYLLFVVFLVFTINLVNFMDGMDLYVISTFFISSLGFHFYFSESFELGSLLFFTLSLFFATSFGFIFYNFPKARLFMGDSGSLAIGFFLCSLPLFPTSTPNTHINIFTYFLLFPYFWVDGVYILLKRSFEKKHVLSAHREHLYQRLTETRIGKLGSLVLFSILNATSVLLFIGLTTIGVREFTLFVSYILYILTSYGILWTFVPRKNLALPKA